MSRELDTLLLELGYAPKETTRKANYITYFKQSEAIEDLLTAIGAPVSAMELMNAKAEKLLRQRGQPAGSTVRPPMWTRPWTPPWSSAGPSDSAGPGGPGDPLPQASGGRPASGGPP